MDRSELLRSIFSDAGVRGWVHATPVADQVDDRDETALDADETVAMTSLYKLLLAVSWCRAVDRDDLDPAQPLVHEPQAHAPGPTGLSTFEDRAWLSQRDTVRMMMTLSDNSAADAILAQVGLDQVNEDGRALGMTHTIVRGGAVDAQRIAIDDTGAADFDQALRVLADVDRAAEGAAYDPAFVSATTARDMTRLLSAIWVDEAADPTSCAFVRQIMGQQAYGHRLASGFPHDDVVVAGKTGTLSALRHEVGVVSFPDEVPVAVAVLTHAARPAARLPVADAAIGAAGRTAVTPLRRPTRRSDQRSGS